MKVFLDYDDPDRAAVVRFPLNLDNSEEPVYAERYNEDGSYEVYKDHTVDFQKLINSSFDASLLENILSRADQGDYSGFTKPVYADASRAPSDYMELAQLSRNASEVYASLSADVRKEFPDVESFYKALISGKLAQAQPEPTKASSSPQDDDE